MYTHVGEQSLLSVTPWVGSFRTAANTLLRLCTHPILLQCALILASPFLCVILPPAICVSLIRYFIKTTCISS
ncbi:hypothetical protein EGR_08096 [Echinococcus granulosus]|uniref:Uncharacterized protein n=1 Tax=Echinococcus granulosus TaxID=6210 RepID=W6U762_ECHGR|nr:hypothetical protein EGR_08096 [Echinococcus granulosus]EUB57020.1 hypothetical protein EGR_08096 [Echinococcus granulosus]